MGITARILTRHAMGAGGYRTCIKYDMSYLIKRCELCNQDLVTLDTNIHLIDTRHRTYYVC
jgi:hypothetical protein